MPSSGRHVLDIKKPASSRTKARSSMGQLFTPKQKPKRLKDQRRKTRIIVSCLCALSALVFIGALSAVTHIDQLAIRDISVSGARALSSEAVVASASAALKDDGFTFFSRENMFLYPRGAIEKTLATDFPRIKNVSLSRPSLLAQAVIVTVEERTLYAQWCAEQCFLMDSSGFIFAEVASETAELSYVFHGGLAPGRSPIGQWFLRGRLPSTIGLIEKIQQAGYGVLSLSVDSEKDFSIQITDGPKLMLSFEMDADTAVRNLQTALDADGLRARFGELEYIDLRFGNRVYYK